jgi:hypothetical protein
MFADSTLRRPPLPFPARPQAHSPVVLQADSEASGRRRRWTIGGGRTADEAVGAARGALPLGAPWQLIGLRTLYGQ